MLNRFIISSTHSLSGLFIALSIMIPATLSWGITGMNPEFSAPMPVMVGPGGTTGPVRTLSQTLQQLHPFSSPHSQQTFSLTQAFNNGLASFDKLVVSMLRQQGLSPKIGIQVSGQGSSLQFHYHTNGLPICSYQAVARVVSGSAPVVLGSIPAGELHWNSDPNVGIDFGAVELQIDNIFPEGHEISSHRLCAFVRNKQLYPVVEVFLTAQEHPYVVWANEGEVLDKEARYFDVDGTSRVYATSPAVKTLVEVTLRGLKGDGTLTSSYFSTEPIGTSRATNAASEFYFEPSDTRFAEVSVFTHASLMLSFFRDLGYVGKKSELILLKIHDTPSNTVNNAEYLPADGSSDGVPRIRIGDGDGEVLQNLPLDIEVVSHEFGHHVVFDYLKSTKGPSLTIHEAFADFFTMARNDDPCLAESVCPANALAYPQGACWIAGKCLRTADNTLKLNDTVVSSDGHRRGQVVSGLLWDLRQLYGVPKADVTKIAFTAVKYFPETITFTDLIVALMSADKEVLASKYSCAILAAAKERGFTDFVAALTCSGPLYSKAGKEVRYSDRLVNISSESDAPG